MWSSGALVTFVTGFDRAASRLFVFVAIVLGLAHFNLFEIPRAVLDLGFLYLLVNVIMLPNWLRFELRKPRPGHCHFCNALMRPKSLYCPTCGSSSGLRAG